MRVRGKVGIRWKMGIGGKVGLEGRWGLEVYSFHFLDDRCDCNEQFI